EVKALVRAYRAYLNAFRLAPDDSETVGHLWRLAGSIGNYHDYALASAAAAAPPPAAEVTEPAPTGNSEEIAVDLEDDVDDEGEIETAARASASDGETQVTDAARDGAAWRP